MSHNENVVKNSSKILNLLPPSDVVEAGLLPQLSLGFLCVGVGILMVFGALNNLELSSTSNLDTFILL